MICRYWRCNALALRLKRDIMILRPEVHMSLDLVDFSSPQMAPAYAHPMYQSDLSLDCRIYTNTSVYIYIFIYEVVSQQEKVLLESEEMLMTVELMEEASSYSGSERMGS